jgi:hypothetical protein
MIFCQRLTVLVLLGTVLTACVKDKKKGDDDAVDLPPKPVVTDVKTDTSKVNIMSVRVELREDGMLLHVGDVPSGAKLECLLDKTPLVPCHDGALFVRPADGEHVVGVAAFKDGLKVAVGASDRFKILAGTGGAFDAHNNPRNPLTLVVDDAKFVDEMAIPMTADFAARFRFANKRPASACKAKLKCQYDSQQSGFWTDCDAGAASYTVSKELMALGRQSLSVQASCADELGPILTMTWYGVPAGYQPLMLRVVKDPQKRQIVNLVKANDCPASLSQTFECAEPNDDDFALCPSGGNTFDNPPSGYQVRIVCDGKAGPILKL